MLHWSVSCVTIDLHSIACELDIGVAFRNEERGIKDVSTEYSYREL